MKKLILLLLFIPLVSFGQEDVDFDSNLNLTVKDSLPNYFGVGLKYDYTDALINNSGVGEMSVLILDLNYVIKNKFLVGLEYGNSFEKIRSNRNHFEKYGIRLGYKLSEKFLIAYSNGIYNDLKRSDNDIIKYSKLAVAFGSKNLIPEIGLFKFYNERQNELGASLGFIYFFKPKSSKNKKFKDNNDVYTELKKLNELLELGIITQEEYVKKAEELKKVILD